MARERRGPEVQPGKQPFSFDREPAAIVADMTGARVTHGDRTGFITGMGEFPAEVITNPSKYGSAQRKKPGAVTGFHVMRGKILTDITVGGEDGKRSLVEIQGLEAMRDDGTVEFIVAKTKVSEHLGIGNGFDGMMVEEAPTRGEHRAFRIVSREEYEAMHEQTPDFGPKSGKVTEAMRQQVGANVDNMLEALKVTDDSSK